MKTYATLGPACCRADLLTELLDMGLTGFRLNLSHTTLAACRPWTEAVQQARATSGRPAELIVDMRGPELRMGPLSRPMTLTAGETVTLGPGGLPVEPDILAAVAPGQEILLDDGLMALRAETCGRAVTCTVTRGGVLESRKSITLPGVELCRPALTEQDLLDLDAAAGQGVTAVMQPFVRSRHELEDLFEITTEQNTITVTNRGDSAVSQVYVYYKNASGDLLLGGITYRVGLTDLGPGETQSCYAGHFSDGSRLLFVTYAP